MKTESYCKNLIFLSVLAAGFLFSAVFVSVYAAEGDATPAPEQISAALEDLSAATGQTIGTKEAAAEVCDSEKYFTVCADIGKNHDLYEEEEIKQVDEFISEIKGNIADQLQSCQTTECLISVANELANKLNTKKSSTLGADFELTPKLVQKKQAVVAAAKELGVSFDDCYKMDPDNASIELLRSCAKLAKDNRVRDTIPESVKRSTEGLAGYNDKMVEFRSSLATGEFQCGDGTLNGCGNFCLNPNKEARTQGTAGIPQVCRDIAKKFFGADGEKQLESAYTQVGQTQEFYLKKAESVIFKTLDGKTLTSLEDIGDYMESQGKQGNVEAVEKGMDFMIAKGFINPEEKEYALKFVRQARDRGGIPDFDSCRLDPESCRDFIPEDQKAEFEIGIKIDQIMKQEIGFDPRECDKGESDPTIGQKCFEGSKRALPKLEALAAQSREAAFIVADIKQHISRGDEFEKNKSQIQQVFRSQTGGPGGCKSEQECFAFCSNPTNTPECISFGAKQGVFRGNEAVEKFQQFNNVLQSQQLPTNYVNQGSQYQHQGDYQGGFPGQGYGVQGGFPGQGYGVQGGFPGQGGYQGGGFPGQFGGPAGPSPECFAAIQSGDFAKAKTTCSVTPVQIDVRTQSVTASTPLPSNLIGICPGLPSVDYCPQGYKKVVSFSSSECGTYWACQQEGGYGTPTSCPFGYHWEFNVCKPDQSGTYLPYPTYTQYPGDTNSCPGFSYSRWDRSGKRYCQLNNEKKCDYNYPSYLTNGSNYSSGNCPVEDNYTFPSCPAGQWWDSAKSACVSGTYSYSPYPSSCSQSLINLLGTGCHQMYTDSTGKQIFCNSEMTNSAKEGDTATTAGCTSGSQPYPSNGGTYSPYPYPSGTPTSGGSCPSGSHVMYVNNAGGYCMSDSDSAKCGPMNSTSTSGFGSCSTYQSSTTYSPYPTGGYTYTPAPSCPSGQWWDYSRNACVSSTSTYSPTPIGTYTYSPTPTTSSSCPTGSHNMGSYCMSDSDGSKCAAFGETSVSTFGSCSSFGGGTASYTPYPSPGTCPVGQYWYWPTSGAGYCKTNEPYPSYSTAPGTSYTPYPSCPAGEWWDSSTSSCKTTSVSYTPYPTTSYTPYPTTEHTPYPTTQYTPYPTTEYTPPPSCPSGQYWNGSSCVSSSPTSFDMKAHQMATARTIMACSGSGGSWNAGTSSCAVKSGGFFANILKVFSKFIIGR